MNEKEALEVIKQYELHPPKPTMYYYNDPNFIDAILERDKNCKPYDPEKDSTEIKDEKICDELAKRFTSLMKRASESERSTINEYRKNNSHLYSMSTKVNGKYITIIPMQLMTEVEFKEKASSACETLQLNNYHIYRHIDESDKDGCEIFKSFPLGGSCITDAAKTAFSAALRYCDYIKKHAKESLNYEVVESLCDSTRKCIENLYNVIDADYLQ